MKNWRGGGRGYLAVIAPTQAFPQCEFRHLEAAADEVVDGIEHVKVHDAKGGAGLCEEHVVDRLRSEFVSQGRLPSILNPMPMVRLCTRTHNRFCRCGKNG